MRKKIFAPKLYPLNRDLAKHWYVEYRDKAHRPLKMRGKLNQLKTLAERLEEAERLIKIILAPSYEHAHRRNDLITLLCERIEYKKPSIEIKTYESYTCIVKLYAAWYRSEVTTKKQLQPGEYVMYLYNEGLHKNTIRNKIIVLKSLCNELVKEGELKSNPFENINIRKQKAQSKLPFNKFQIERLRQEIEPTDKQLWLIIQFLYYLYLRPKEVRFLTIADIDVDTMKLKLAGSIAKDDDTIYKAIPLQLQPQIIQLLHYPSDYFIFGKNGLPGPTPLSKNHMTTRMRLVIQKLKLGSRYSLYSWVHTGIKNAALSGIPIKQLQLQKGHADLKMFDEYLKDLCLEDCVQLVNDFPSL